MRETLRQSGKAGIARVVIRTRENLAAMFVRDDVIVLELMRFPDELRSPAKLDLPSSDDAQFEPTKKGLELAMRLVEDLHRREDFLAGYRGRKGRGTRQRQWRDGEQYH